jgi:1,4-dihydroxy-2-naphthoate octaprenyltransferase
LRVDWVGLVLAVSIGALSSAVLVANNLRDIPTDKQTGKRTLAVALGDAGTRRLYLGLVAVPLLVSIGLGFSHPWVLIGVVAGAFLVTPVRVISGGAKGMALIPVLKDTGLAMLMWSAVTALALAFG